MFILKLQNKGTDIVFRLLPDVSDVTWYNTVAMQLLFKFAKYNDSHLLYQITDTQIGLKQYLHFHSKQFWKNDDSFCVPYAFTQGQI